MRRARISLLIIAASLAIVTAALNLSAYLTTKTDTLDESLRVDADEVFELNLYTTDYTKPARIMPGDVIAFNPTISRGEMPCYVFVKFICEGDQSLFESIREK